MASALCVAKTFSEFSNKSSGRSASWEPSINFSTAWVIPPWSRVRGTTEPIPKLKRLLKKVP
jgi:hypothetical protein